jgi:ATP-dependent RNA helicase DDX54/DBP10
VYAPILLFLAFCYAVRADDKPAALLWLVREGLPQGSSTLVFASTRHHVEFLHNLMSHEGVPAACVFGSMDQVGCCYGCTLCDACLLLDCAHP